MCPPVTLLFALRAVFAGTQIALGGQDCHVSAEGAHTGDVSPLMLADAGCAYVIVGHSERRASHGENNEWVAGKAAAAHAAGLTAIVCVGESAADRDAGRALAMIGRQIEGSLPATATPDNTAIAYEPVWAIGSGRTPGPADIEATHAKVRAAAIFGKRRGAPRAIWRLRHGAERRRHPGRAVDGVLVGASLSADALADLACRRARRLVARSGSGNDPARPDRHRHHDDRSRAAAQRGRRARHRRSGRYVLDARHGQSAYSRRRGWRQPS